MVPMKCINSIYFINPYHVVSRYAHTFTILVFIQILSRIGLFGVNEKLLTQHISGPVTKYELLYVNNQGRAGARVRAKG